jgi:hypothetical protein
LAARGIAGSSSSGGGGGALFSYSIYFPSRFYNLSHGGYAELKVKGLSRAKRE